MTSRRDPGAPPPMRRDRLPLRSRCRRGAAGLLFFALIGLPLLFFTAALSVDITMHIMASNQASAVAEAAARAGAFQQQTDTDRLHGLAARNAARDTFNRARAERVMSLTRDPQMSSRLQRGREVEVTVSFALPVRTFTKYFLPGTSSSERFSVTRTAMVCTPGASFQPNGGFCAAPRP